MFCQARTLRPMGDIKVVHTLTKLSSTSKTLPVVEDFLGEGDRCDIDDRRLELCSGPGGVDMRDPMKKANVDPTSGVDETPMFPLQSSVKDLNKW